ncbi:scavenger receptor cysteine-rich type 1 protein M130-like [Eudromia elegans]
MVTNNLLLAPALGLLLCTQLCCGTGELRLVDGGSRCAGRVEVKHEGQWGSVCSYDFDWGVPAASVVCRQLGCGTVARASPYTPFGAGAGRIWLHPFFCRGTEAALHDCPHFGWGQHFCDHKTDVGVTCSDAVQLRLVNGTGPCEGRVEVKLHGQWGTVADDSWDMEDAEVVCQQLGCGSAKSAHISTRFGQGSGPIHVALADCRGNESALWECTIPGWGSYTGPHDWDVGVTCQGFVRLVDGDGACSGRVEVRQGREWATLCTAYMDLNTAHVICKELGCGAALAVTSTDPFGSGAGPIWDGGFECAGNESLLSACARKQPHSQGCTHANDTGIICSPYTDFRLVNGSTACAGRVEMQLRGTWRSLCDTGWDQRDAQVLCHQLGWPSSAEPLRLVGGQSRCDGRLEVALRGAWTRVLAQHWDASSTSVVCRQLRCGQAQKASVAAVPGPASTPVGLSGLRCVGTEARLAQCNSTLPNATAVGHAGDVAVVCSESRHVRLASGPGRCAGRVELYVQGAWRRVCEDHWDLRDAAVVCRQLGCGRALAAPRSAHYGRGSGLVWWGAGGCLGSEATLWDCPVPAPGLTALRLVGDSSCAGRLELLYNGTWGSVCANGTSADTATVVCQQLGCGAAGRLVPAPENAGGSGPAWLSWVKCVPGADSLWRCPSAPWHLQPCDSAGDTHITCDWQAAGTTGPPTPATATLCPDGTACTGPGTDADAAYEAVYEELDYTLTPVYQMPSGSGTPAVTRHDLLDGYDDAEAVRDMGEAAASGLSNRVLGETAALGEGGRPSLSPTEAAGDATDAPSSALTDTGYDDVGVGSPTTSLSLWQWYYETIPILQRCAISQCEMQLDEQREKQAVRERLFSSPADVCAVKTIGGRWWSRSETGAVDRGQEKTSMVTNNLLLATALGLLLCTQLCCGTGELRLVNGGSRCAGRVEVKHEGQWGSVCSYDFHWNVRGASVVCRQLGCGTVARAFPHTRFGAGAGQIWLHPYRCQGTEEALHDCLHYGWGQHLCDHDMDVGVTCSGAVEIRLVNGTGPCEGRVEVKIQGQWGTVVDDSWDMEDAEVVCQQLGCGSAKSAHISTCFGEGSGPIHLVRIDCRGFVRLVGGDGACSGRVEVRQGREWATLCTAHMDLNTAHVICKELGCGAALAVTSADQFGSGAGPIWDGGFECAGNESLLSACARKQPQRQECTHANDTSIICSPYTDFRLVNGSTACAGRVEMQLRGTWRSLCDTGWDQRDAQVLCHQLGWPSSAEPLRLVGGQSRCDGRLEVALRGAWTRVLAQHWDASSASVVCRQLRCGQAQKVSVAAVPGPASTPVGLSGLQCVGTEDHLAQCNSTLPNATAAGHAGDVAVVCLGLTALRLMGDSSCAGRLELLYNGTWGSVCANGTSADTATVVCRQLGCGAAGTPSSLAARDGSMPVPTMLCIVLGTLLCLALGALAVQAWRPGTDADAAYEAVYEELDYTLTPEYQEMPSGSGSATKLPYYTSKSVEADSTGTAPGTPAVTRHDPLYGYDDAEAVRDPGEAAASGLSNRVVGETAALGEGRRPSLSPTEAAGDATDALSSALTDPGYDDVGVGSPTTSL